MNNSIIDYIRNKKQIHYSLFIVLLVAIISILQTNYTRIQKLDLFAIVTFFINGVTWFYLFFKELRKYPYSLAGMQWLFFFFFFFLAAFVQYASEDEYPWKTINTGIYEIKGNMYLLVWTMFFTLGQRSFIRKKKLNHDFYYNKSLHIINYIRKFDYTMILVFVTIISVLSVSFRIHKIGLFNMFSRSSSYIKSEDPSTISMMLNGFLQAITYFGVILAIYGAKIYKSLLYSTLLLINIVFLCLGYFPTYIARYSMAVIYAGIFITFFPNFQKNRKFILFFIGAFILLFPIFNAFKELAFANAISSVVDIFYSITTSIAKRWVFFDYDAYGIFLLTIKHIEVYGIGGNHILSILFFWFPRSIWTTKAVSGSYELSRLYGLSFTNLSFPIVADAVIDGGVIGIIVLGLLLGMFTRYIDSYYWFLHRDLEVNIFYKEDLIYPVAILFFFFFCRGDMMYTFAYFIPYLITWYILSFLMKPTSSLLKTSETTQISSNFC